MDKSYDIIKWLEIQKIPTDIKEKINTLGIISIGVCFRYKIIIAKTDSDIICPEIVDNLCANINSCPHEAIETDLKHVILLNDSNLKNFVSKLGLIDKKVTPKDIPKGKKEKKEEQHLDKFAKQAFAKLKFELTQKIAAENPNIEALKKALIEEFGMPNVPEELIAVFNMEIKKNKAKKLGVKFTDYLLLEKEKKNK
ncbi:MAG: hypothetical protein HQK79_17255 [Desulfobacterales bacterium]|nr:hypothetical protein [Desulfobacterales bacterium]